jgi:hypothetical protein
MVTWLTVKLRLLCRHPPRYKQDIGDIAEETVRRRSASPGHLPLPGGKRRRLPSPAPSADPAEEAAKLPPDVVVRGADGQAEGIDYRHFPAIYATTAEAHRRGSALSAVQRQDAVIGSQRSGCWRSNPASSSRRGGNGLGRT